MSDLTDACTGLVDLLTEAGVHAVTPITETFTPPICMVEATGRQPGQTFSRKKIGVTVLCFGGLGTNSESVSKANELSEQVADIIAGSFPTYRLDPDEEISQIQMYNTAQGQRGAARAVNAFYEAIRV